MKHLVGVRVDDEIKREEEHYGEYKLNVQRDDDGFVRIEMSNSQQGIYMEVNQEVANWLGFELIRLTYDTMESSKPQNSEKRS